MKLLPKTHLATLAAVLLFVSSRVFACSCSTPGPVDVVFARASNVVVMKLQSVEKPKSGEKRVGYGGIRSADLLVERVYKGNLKVGQVLTFAQGGGADCIWTFDQDEVGSEFLFFLGAKPFADGMWVAFTCSRSASIQYGGADLLYLDNLRAVAGRSRLSGVFTQRIDSAVEGQPSSEDVLPERTVEMIGNGKTHKLKTDRNGVYEIYDLPPGKYEVRPEGIPGYRIDTSGQAVPSETVEIKRHTHTEQNFQFVIDNAIRGKFFDTNGKPLKDVCLKLIPAHGKIAQYFSNFDCTNDDGSFELHEIPSGSYLLLFNDDDKVMAATPFRAFYYPNVRRREDAAEIQIGPGTVIDGLKVIAPETAEVITVSGVLKFVDGKIANKKNTDATIIFTNRNGKPDITKADSRADIDDNGRFSIRILKGQTGYIYGTMLTFSGEYENCPKLEALIKKQRTQVAEIATPGVFVKADNDITGLELKLPFPACKKPKEN